MAKHNALRAESGMEAKPRPTPVWRTTDTIDNAIHERTRLGIVSALAVNDALTFTQLKHLLGLTDGNLSVHTRKLEDASYLDVHKSFAGRKPRTEYRLSRAGRRALEKYLAHMEALVHATRAREEEA